jgi:hypothetical protein
MKWRLSMKKGHDMSELMEEFPVGTLVAIEWVGGLDVDIDEGPGEELGAPEPAIVLGHMPELSFRSAEGISVLPFECLHRGAIRSSTTYACKRLGLQ